MKTVARMLRSHRGLILNGFAAKETMSSSGAVEGLNNTLNLVTRKSYGFRTFPVARLALFHRLGNLPEHEGTDKFC
jgi:transposase